MKEINKYLGVISIIVLFVGVTFKKMHWPGADILILVSLGALLVTGILLVIDSILETDPNKQSIKTLFAFILIVLVVILYMLSPVLHIISKTA